MNRQRKKSKGTNKSPKSGEVVILITAPSTEEAQKIAHSLVAEHLVACANIISQVQSIFFWQGKVRDEREVLVICKSRAPLFGKISRRVKELHSYTVPEIIALPIIKGSTDYLHWIHEVTNKG